MLAKGTPQLALMYGRRRVGKTHLLTHTWPTSTRLFYFTAAETTAGQNRAALLESIQRFTGETLDPSAFGAWRNIFRQLLEMEGSHPLVVVLDEFQYFGDGTEQGLRDVASQLNAEWETQRPARALVFVLCGSAIRLIEALNTGGSPLYGRFEWVCQLEPFDYWHAAQMVPYQSLRARAATYAVFGGTPRYLASIDTTESLVANIARLSLSKQGTVRQLVETALLQEQGLRDHATYNAILRAIGAGRTELNAIKQGAAIGDGDFTATRNKIDRLIALGYVRRERNFGAKNTQAFRYRLADPAQAFHMAFVTRYQAMLEQYDPSDVFKQHIASVFDAYLGRQFEVIAQQAYHRLQQQRALPMAREWGRWEGRDRDRTSVEIGIVTRLADGRMMTGGVKWSEHPAAGTWHRHHIECLERLAQSGQRWAHDALQPDAPILWVAAGGFEPGFEAVVRERHNEVMLLSLHDLYD